MPRWIRHSQQNHRTCFHCRKVFSYSGGGMICPQCGGTLHELGKNFKAPRRTDLKQWEKVERLWQHGVTFQPGEHDLTRPPKRLNEVDAFLEAHDREKLQREQERKLCSSRKAWTR